MTDDEMGARLTAAGTAWRAATDAPTVSAPADQPDALLPPSAPPRRTAHRFALLASAAAVAAALVVGGLFALRGTGDGNRSADQGVALEGTVWKLLGYDDRSASDSTSTLYIGKGGALVADDTCNLLTGKVEVDGNHFSVDDLDRRFYNCTDSVGEVTFDRGVEVLQSRPTWSTDGARLTISGAGRTMHLVAADRLLPPTADRPTMTGAEWQLTKVVDADGQEHVVRGAPTLRIDKGQLRASDSCNTMSGAVRVDGQSVEPAAGGLAITEIGCPEDVQATATVVDAVFAGKAQAEVTGATLTVKRAGAGTLTYRWRPQDEQATDTSRLKSTTWRLASLAGQPVSDPIRLDLTVDGRVTVAGQCEPISGDVVLGRGTLATAGLPADAPKGCTGEMSTLLSFLTSPPTLWSIQDDHLLLYGGGAQGFSLVFEPVSPLPPSTAALNGAWKLTGVTVEDGTTASGSGSSDLGVTLTLSESNYRLEGTGCIGYRGSVAVSDRTIDFSNQVNTNGDLCTSDIRDDLVSVFDGTAAWSVRGGLLTLKKGAVTLTFER